MSCYQLIITISFKSKTFIPRRAFTGNSHFVCDLCDADYVGYTARHLFQRVAEDKNSAIGKHFHEARDRRDRLNESHF